MAQLRSHIASSLLLLIPLCSFVKADTPALTIVHPNDTYTYAGCWNETTDLPGTSDLRALDVGIHEIRPDAMTVSVCLDYCAKNTSTKYHYAGLEYSRECWCARKLSSLSVKLADGECNTPCDGDNTTACGGSLKLSVYNLTSGTNGIGPGVSVPWLVGGVVLGVVTTLGPYVGVAL